MSRLGIAVPLTVLALTGALLAPAAAHNPAGSEVPTTPAALQVDAPVPDLTWEPCDDLEAPDGVDLQCATATVPLDYDDPTGEPLALDLARVPAADQANRIGSLFVNPGGPGGSSREFVSFFGQLVPQAVSDHFDVVGVDPRGVGPSARMVCQTDERRPSFPRAFFPTNDRQVGIQIRFESWFRRACRDNPAPVVAHMSTADTARDMDLVRQAVGDDLLSYYGISYGTQLGTTYAAMFPDRIRAMILDGVLDPVAWTTGVGDEATTRPFSERLRSGYGAWQALTAAFAECDRVGKRRCPIAGKAAQTWNDIVKRLRRGPFTSDRFGRLTYDLMVGVALSSLYDQSGLPPLMRDLGRVHRAMFKDRGRVAARSLRPEAIMRRTTDARGIPGPYAPGFARTGNSFAGVACADSDNPRKPRAWVPAGRRADRGSPWFGKLWTWASSICAGWPAAAKEDRYSGPFEVTTSEEVMVVGNTYDPATPLHGARAVNRLLDGSRLLVLDGWGHGAIGTGPCVSQAFGDYLVDGVLPRPGTVCRPGAPVFPR